MASLDNERKNKKPRIITEAEKDRLAEFIDSIHYSARQAALFLRSRGPLLIKIPRYSDAQYEYRHVQLPKAMLKVIPKEYFDPSKGTLKILWEEEWRGLGVTQVSVEVRYNEMTAANENL
jgi:hypothetical protein